MRYQRNLYTAEKYINGLIPLLIL